MSDALSRRLQQPRFSGPAQEAILSVLVAANTLNDIMDDVCRKHDITRPQYNVLRILRGVHPSGHARCDIARRMVERAPDVTRLVDRLQARGLVKRQRGNDDQRQAVTCITAKGLKLLHNMQPEIDKQMEGIRPPERRRLHPVVPSVFATLRRSACSHLPLDGSTRELQDCGFPASIANLNPLLPSRI